VVHLLLENGADPARRDNIGLTPYDVAVQNGQDNTAQMIKDFNPRASRSTPGRR